jgi:hypothetical protein
LTNRSRAEGEVEIKMTALIECLDGLDRLVQKARRKTIRPEEFAAGVHKAMQKVQTLLVNPPIAFLNAYSILTETILEYERNPDLAGVGRIGNALVGYRRVVREEGRSV